jgi:hypothetical protein
LLYFPPEISPDPGKVQSTKNEVQTEVGSTKFEGRTTAGWPQTLYFVIRTSYFEFQEPVLWVSYPEIAIQ